jgi:hypothetical protein
MSFINVIFIAAILSRSAYGYCPSCEEDWKGPHEEDMTCSCYKLYGSGLTNATVSWADSEAACVAQGGHLASLTTAEEQAHVQVTFQYRQSPTWIGLHYMGSQWHTGGWMDGSPYSAAETNWVNPTPGVDVVVPNLSNNFCVVMNLSGKWYDWPCAVQVYTAYLCELNPDWAPTYLLGGGVGAGAGLGAQRLVSYVDNTYTTLKLIRKDGHMHVHVEESVDVDSTRSWTNGKGLRLSELLCGAGRCEDAATGTRVKGFYGDPWSGTSDDEVAQAALFETAWPKEVFGPHSPAAPLQDRGNHNKNALYPYIMKASKRSEHRADCGGTATSTTDRKLLPYPFVQVCDTTRTDCEASTTRPGGSKCLANTCRNTASYYTPLIDLGTFADLEKVSDVYRTTNGTVYMFLLGAVEASHLLSYNSGTAVWERDGLPIKGSDYYEFKSYEPVCDGHLYSLMVDNAVFNATNGGSVQIQGSNILPFTPTFLVTAELCQTSEGNIGMKLHVTVHSGEGDGDWWVLSGYNATEGCVGAGRLDDVTLLESDLEDGGRAPKYTLGRNDTCITTVNGNPCDALKAAYAGCTDPYTTLYFDRFIVDNNNPGNATGAGYFVNRTNSTHGSSAVQIKAEWTCDSSHTPTHTIVVKSEAFGTRELHPDGSIYKPITVGVKYEGISPYDDLEITGAKYCLKDPPYHCVNSPSEKNVCDVHCNSTMQSGPVPCNPCTGLSYSDSNANATCGAFFNATAVNAHAFSTIPIYSDYILKLSGTLSSCVYHTPTCPSPPCGKRRLSASDSGQATWSTSVTIRAYEDADGHEEEEFPWHWVSLGTIVVMGCFLFAWIELKKSRECERKRAPRYPRYRAVPRDRSLEMPGRFL